MDSTKVADILGSPRARAAIARGDTGTLIQLVRRHRRLRQADLGNQVGLSQSAVSRLERGGTRATDDAAVLASVARVLQIPLAVLGITAGGFSDAKPGNTLAGNGREGDMQRRNLLRGIAGITAALALPPAMTDDDPVIDPAHVTACQRSLDRLYSMESRMGGGHVAAVNDELIGRMQRLLTTARFTGNAKDQLSEVLAEALENAGWLAYDAGQNEVARRHWLECLHTADIGQHPAVRTIVLASMSLQAATIGRGGEAAQLAQAAARDQAATPRVRALLAAREGLGHAVNKDRAASHRAFTTADALFDRGRSPADPAWIGFFGPADFMSHQVQAAVQLGEFPRAERTARQCASDVDAAQWERNQLLYKVRLGTILAGRGALDEAMSELTPAVSGMLTISSGRLRGRLSAAVRRISTYRGHRPAMEWVAWANRMSATA